MRFETNLYGFEEVDKALSTLLPNVEKKAVRKSLRAGAKDILQQARANLAEIRKTGIRTGPIIKGMKVRALKRRRTVSNRGRIGVGVFTPTRAELGIPADARSYYPAHIELGTRKRPAMPYLRDAHKTKGQAVIHTIVAALLAAIEREAKR